MRLVFLAAAAMLAATPSSAAPLRAGDMPVIDPAPQDRANCPPISRYHAMKEGRPLTGRKLADLPPADTYKAAYRTINGCEVPIIARYGVKDGR